MAKALEYPIVFKALLTGGHETLEKGFIICDKCGEHLEFHCEDDDEDDRT